MIMNMQEQLAKRIAAANSRAQTKNIAVVTPVAAASSSRVVSTMGPDLIRENKSIHFTLHHVPLQGTSRQTPRSSRHRGWQKQGKKPRIDAPAQAYPIPRRSAAGDARHNHSNSAWQRTLGADEGEDIIANKKAQQPIRCNENMAAAQVTSHSHYGRILSPDHNECFRMGNGCIMAPSANPVTHMMKKNLHPRAHTELGVPPTSSMENPDAGNRHRQGAYAKQALQQQQRRRNLDSQEEHADMCATPQQLTAIELTSVHIVQHGSV